MGEVGDQTDMAVTEVTSVHEGHTEVKAGDPSGDCDICITTANGINTVVKESSNDNGVVSTEVTTAADNDKDITDTTDPTKKAFELVEAVNSQEETEDESDDEEMQHFLSLMNKAERKNQKKISAVQTFHFGAKSRVDWRNVEMEDPESDTTDTEDEDDTVETRRFLSLMGNTRQQRPESRPMVTIKWENGKVVGLPAGIKVTRVGQDEEARRRHEEELKERRRQHLEVIRREGPTTTTCSGKRKFEDRMTLSEAKADDFTDTKDYVDFIQAKLKNVNIKIIK